MNTLNFQCSGAAPFVLPVCVCVCDPLHSRTLLCYSWDLLMHYRGWMETRESIRCRLLCWRLMSGVGRHRHVSKCPTWLCFSGDLHFLFFLLCLCHLFLTLVSRLMTLRFLTLEYSSIFKLCLEFYFPLLTSGATWETFPCFLLFLLQIFFPMRFFHPELWIHPHINTEQNITHQWTAEIPFYTVHDPQHFVQEVETDHF